MNSPHPADLPHSFPRRLPCQVVLVLQGGGALGSYQGGVCQALQEAGIEPDWIIGTSIGASTQLPSLATRHSADWSD